MMGYNEIQAVLATHTQVIEGASPIPSREEHNWNVGEALQAALDLLDEKASVIDLAYEGGFADGLSEGFADGLSEGIEEGKLVSIADGAVD